jgi:glycosyltransferase involved in cell wall biosynthesis
MRVGQNPIKAVEKIAPPAPVTVVIISYIPFLGGYYAESLEILKLCLGSLQANTEGEFDVLVFDNGSCVEVREYLLAEHAEGRIQYLTLSERNLGKPAAWNSALLAAPGEFVAYADSDVYFYPGWLQASLAALQEFPQAGMVTAMPILVPEKYSSATLKWAKKQAGVKTERGSLLPWDDFWRHARSLGDEEQQARRFYDGNEATKISYKKKSYYVGAAHFQFTARKSALQAVLPIPADRPMGQVRLLDEAIDAEGFLRLCTSSWYVQHLGNTMPQPGDLIGSAAIAKSPKKRLGNPGIWRWPPLRRLLKWLNAWSFDRLHRTDQGK